MAVETVAISCPAGSYTKIADNKNFCSFRFRTLGTGRMAIATSQPSPSETNYVTVRSAFPTEVGSMSGTEDVYFMPNGGAAIELEVVRG